MKFDQLAEAFNVRADSDRAAALKRLALGKPVPLTAEMKGSIPHLRKRGKKLGFTIEVSEDGKYTLKAKGKRAA